MGRSGRGEIHRWVGSLLRFDRLSWWLVVLAVLALLGQEIVRTSGLVVAVSAEFEGFGDELEEIEEDLGEPFVVPPPVLKEPGFQNDRGPPSEVEDDDETVDLKSDGISTPSSPSGLVKDSEVKKVQEFWDEDEFEGLPEETAEELIVTPPRETSPAGSKQSTPTAAAAATKKQVVPKGPQTYYIEAVSILFLIAYITVYFVGRKRNEKLALAWAAQFACKDGVFDKNFSLLGTGDGVDSPLLMKEGQNVFKFYASGRRYCEGLLATMDFQSRHDLIALIWYMISPRKDEMTVDVFMNEDSMDSLVFAVARRKNAKTMHKERADLLQYASIINVTNRKWLSEELTAISESREVATDLMTDALLEQVFGEKAFEKFASHFISMHFTDQSPYGAHRKVLQFKFTIPSEDRMAEMSRLISTVTYFIDAVGRYKLSPQTRLKAENARAKVAQEAFKENQGARHEALLRKKEERRKALEEAEAAKLSPEFMRKREEKERARQLKKAMPKIKMTRAH
ncbi:PAT complex subunit CCDC47 [Marchantia polymorpha subsp. ruderalis]|uniref:Coiled-coil domain-containing protein 47 n=2 Tax=Marchantia polymorpha TaxID=3197 RepID=A0A176WFX9_MARPO|nr:hypothetical protein AXG93_4421s1320 [Marchantia polymorpha subsp. ruderalis]PTQ40823.1 hypothetical protein MARPO_0037s0012 [Marchantia polymorpha]BBN05281.1 hypothetical protein Mp_3g11850 [Marchantia polymorpha subsp. ruderalis]|eukprot:PTQ40823.1 hypothetical protein MARPO_0037s0012 [Marchantia polymorpha]